MKQTIYLVKLNDVQIATAKAANGSRKQITHAVICGNYGQLFGTEKFCRKYFTAWSDIFPLLFNDAIETDKFDISDYNSTAELVIKLIDLHDAKSGNAT